MSFVGDFPPGSVVVRSNTEFALSRVTISKQDDLQHGDLIQVYAEWILLNPDPTLRVYEISTAQFAGGEIYTNQLATTAELQASGTLISYFAANFEGKLRIAVYSPRGNLGSTIDIPMNGGFSEPVIDTLDAQATAAPLNGPAPLTVNFSSSVSGGVAPYAYCWLELNNNIDLGQGSSISHSFASPGDYVIILTVTDNAGGSDTAEVRLTVTEPVTEPGIFDVTAAAQPLTGPAPLSVHFAAHVISGVSPFTYEWLDLDSGVILSTANQFSHIFQSAGTFHILLTAGDSAGGTDTAEVTILVSTPTAPPGPGPGPGPGIVGGLIAVPLFMAALVKTWPEQEQARKRYRAFVVAARRTGRRASRRAKGSIDRAARLFVKEVNKR